MVVTFFVQKYFLKTDICEINRAHFLKSGKHSRSKKLLNVCILDATKQRINDFKYFVSI